MSPGHNGNGDGDGVDVGDYDGAPFYAEIYMEFCNTWVMKMVTINERGGAGGGSQKRILYDRKVIQNMTCNDGKEVIIIFIVETACQSVPSG